MPASIDSARQMNFSSDYPVDKIVWTYEGSRALTGFETADIYIDHNLPFRPLPLAEWTTDPTWTVKYEFSSGPVISSGFSYNTAVSAGSSQVYISLRNNTGIAATIYYRIFCLAPSTVTNNVVPFTNNLANQYTLTTDFVYPKLYEASTYTIPVTSGLQTFSINHNLGAIPQILVWSETTFPSGHIVPVNGSLPEDASTPFAITSNVTYEARINSLVIAARLSSSRLIEYRIYVDEQ